MRAAAYVRVSSREQLEGYSLDQQERIIRDYCATHGWPPPDLFRDEGRSAFTDKTEKRPAFAAMLAAAEAGEYEVIIVHKIDRFARSLVTTLRELQRLEKAHVGFVSVAESMDFTSPIGRVILSVLAAFAEYFSRNLSTEVKKGQAGRKAAGKPPYSRPYGAMVSGNALVVDPAKADHLARILAVAATQGYVRAANTLNEEGIPPRNAKQWSGLAVRAVVRAARWLTEQPDPWPERYIAALSHHPVLPISPRKQIRMLSGLLRCTHCGGTIGYVPRPRNGGTGVQCHRKNGLNHCGGPRKRAAAHYEAIVAAWVAQLPPADELYAAHARQTTDGTGGALATIREERRKLFLAYDAKIVDDTTMLSRAAELDARERAIPPAAQHSERWLGDLVRVRVAFPEFPPVAQNAALRLMIARIEVTGDRCTIVPVPDLAALLPTP